jgi:O-acetyl-ADP-ribose deacetylase (regulator of RNase III)
MKTIHYLVGDATRPLTSGNKIIAHICNDIGGWGKGFVLALSKLSPEPERAYRAWYEMRKQNDFALGAVQFVAVSPEIVIANMIGQHGIRKTGGIPPIRYDAVETALETVGHKALETNASVHLPRIGCGLAGGFWDKIEPLIERQICDKGVRGFVYDLA